MAKKAIDSGFISKASLKNIRVSPRKARLVVDTVRGQDVSQAIDSLAFMPQRTAPALRKLLLSAVANAKESGVDVDELFVKKAWVDEGKKLHRWLPRAHGRATPIKKRSSTITVILDEVGARR
jgi:large subunit ribosomal protein L22